VSDGVMRYIAAITHATRGNEFLALPAGPRASRALYRMGKAVAAMDGRDFVTPDDIKGLAPYVLPHRIVVSGGARLAGKTAEDVVSDILTGVAVPGGAEEILGLRDA